MSSVRDGEKVNTELLSPAGSYDSARAAVNAGADAIYMGGPLFSARAYAESGGDGSMLMKAIDYCHLRGVKIYLTLNTLLKESELGELKECLTPYAEKRLDGVIVQDLGVFSAVRRLYPDLPIHVSTQAAVTGYRTAARYLEMGAKRIVLARELSLAEISEIYEKTHAELEVFAHGALCYSYSGECLMSSFIGGRSGNRGRCAGTCRLPYQICGDGQQILTEYRDKCGKNNKYHTKNSRKRGSIQNIRCEVQGGMADAARAYYLSMKDLSTLRRLPEMIRAGVYSFKIEGRMKSPVYVAAVTGAYRKYLDMAAKALDTGEKQSYEVDPADEALLREVFDRSGTTCAYLDGKCGREMIAADEKPALRIRDEAAINEIKKKYIDEDMKIPITGKAVLRVGELPRLELKSAAGSGNPVMPQGAESFISRHIRGCSVTAEGDAYVQAAKRHAVTRDELAERLGRFGGTDFRLCYLDIDMDDGCFIPVGAINELRRNAAEKLKNSILSCYGRD